MARFARRSLLVQLLGTYVLFVLAVLSASLAVNAVVAQRLQSDVQASDQALAQEVAVQTSLTLRDAESSLVQLSLLPAFHTGQRDAIMSALQAYKSARADVDHVYWLDPLGILLVSVKSPTGPPEAVLPVTEFSPPEVVQRALIQNPTQGPVIEIGLVRSGTYTAGVVRPGTYTAGVVIAEPVFDQPIRANTKPALIGIVATSLSLADLSEPLANVIHAQASQGRQLMISVIDDQGELIATPDQSQILYTVLGQLPGADQALQGQTTTRLGAGPGGQDWLFSSVPVSGTGWAVVVQRPTSQALAVVAEFHVWLLVVALIFILGGLVFWLMLLLRVIRPLHALAVQHRALPSEDLPEPAGVITLAEREDEVGGLARSLKRLESDVLTQLGELRTLLETSNAVVGSLDPQAVVGTIIQEVRRLVDVQAAAVLVPDERGMLRVLVSDGHAEHYDRTVSVPPDDPQYPAALALRDGQPVQNIAIPGSAFPPLSYEEGFRSVLAIPIISRHAGGVVLLVHRTEPQPFSRNEIDLLLTFANYATLAWEHAVLYERSDERLREVARENEQLYRAAMGEKQTLAAIMGSMSDGLVLTGVDGIILYANPGASALAGLDSAALERRHIGVLYAALRAAAADPVAGEQALARAKAGTLPDPIVELSLAGRHRAIHLRQFDVRDESSQLIGRGLLLRDVTRERELDEFKTTLLAAVGHEVRTPLAAIKGHASTLLQEDVAWPPEDQRHFLRTISGEADRLAQLVSNLLDLSRQEAGLLLLNRAPVRMQELVARVVGRQSYPGVHVSVRIPGDLPPLDIDGARVEVVLHNLLANAVVYGEGNVCVSAEHRDDAVVVSVSDNGPGIAQDELPHTFERFYRARRGREQRSGGTGLGLAICKAFVEAHDGTIWAESSGSGTTMSFSLPLASAGTAGTPATTPATERT